jgi:hypothetical protein
VINAVESFTVAKNVFWLVDVGWMGYEEWAAQSANIHQSLHHMSSWYWKVNKIKGKDWNIWNGLVIRRKDEA